MKKQELIQRFNKQLVIENYSSQTIKSYSSALKQFLEFVEKLRIDKITEKEIQDYLYYCEKKKELFLFSNETGNCFYPLSLS